MPPSEASPVRTDFGSINGETVELVRLQVDGLTAELIAVAVIAVAAGIGVVLARVLNGRIGVAAAMAWGLFWIAVGRLTGEPASTITGVAAALAAVVVVAAAALVRTRRGSVRPLPTRTLAPARVRA